METCLCRIAALGGACRVKEEEEELFLLLHLKWEGGLQWANFRCEEQKARFSPYTLTLPCSQYWLADEVSSCSPTELHFDSLYLLVRFISQLYRQGLHYCVENNGMQWPCQGVCGEHLEAGDLHSPGCICVTATWKTYTQHFKSCGNKPVFNKPAYSLGQFKCCSPLPFH